MTPASFAKVLSANDVGQTGGHQAGILVPKGSPDLLAFFPRLDPGQLNPDTWIRAQDADGNEWELRYIYYNNRLHGSGTRNEYRITHLTKCLRGMRARPGDQLIFTATPVSGHYLLSLELSERSRVDTPAITGVIRLRGWRRIH